MDEIYTSRFSRYYGPVYRFYRNRGFNHEECHDLTQDVFLRVFQKASQLEHVDRFERWLFTIASSVWKNALRHRSAQSREADEVSLDEPRGENRSVAEVVKVSPGPLSPTSRDPLGETLEAERRRLLREALEALPDRMRQVMMLRIDQGLAYREIAAALQVSVQTVRKQLYDGKERLKDLLTDPDDDGKSHE